MLPSTYFKNLNCPYFEQDKCERVYCHYRHRKPIEPNTNAYVPTPIANKKSVESKDVLEYKPTPISKSDKSFKNDESKIKEESKQEIDLNNANDKDNEQRKEIKEEDDTFNEQDVYQSIESKLNSIFNNEEKSKGKLF